MTRNFDDEKREPQPIIIEDLRHSRDGQADEEPQPEQAAPQAAPAAAAEPESIEAPTAPEAPAMEVLEPPRAEANPVGAGQEFEPPRPASQQTASHDHDHDHDHDHGDDEAQQAEYMQLLQIFELGLDNYQKNQIGIYIQFAIIHLGRAPHPVTNLVATDLPMARFAIDLLHVTYTNLEPGLQPEERQEFKSVLSNLQLTFAQLAGNVPVPPETQG
jgi:hypothetical protein